MRSWTWLVLTSLLGLGSPARSLAQDRAWSLGAELGITQFWGASRNLDAGGAPGFKPYRPTSVALRVERGLGRLRAGLGVQYSNSAFGLDGEGAALLVKGQLKWVQLTPEVGVHLARLGPAAALRAFAGPLMDIWIPNEDDTRARFGGQGGLELWMPLGAHLATAVRVRGGVAGSLFRETELPDNYELRSMPSLGVALGLRYGL